MLENQIDDYAGADRLTDMVLGILSVSDRVAALASIPRSDGKVADASSLVDFLLGIISTGRTLKATFSCEDNGAMGVGEGGSAPAARAEPGPFDPRIMR